MKCSSTASDISPDYCKYSRLWPLTFRSQNHDSWLYLHETHELLFLSEDKKWESSEAGSWEDRQTE